MLKRLPSLLIVFTLFYSVFVLSTQTFAKEKVLLDADMVEAFDDGVAMLMLANSPHIELVGVTTVTGNSWANAGAAYTLYQLDIAGKGNIPVAIGSQFPFRADRHKNILPERQMFGIGVDIWAGSFGHKAPDDWKSYFEEKYNYQPTTFPVAEHGVDFIINTVRKNPNEITIAVIGPCTNLAMAIRKAPDIIPLIKRVIYMGGAFYTPGNVTPAAEFNWWLDPEAAKMTIRAPFKEQIVVGLDVAEKIVFARDNYDRFLNTLNNNALAKLLKRSHVGVSFSKQVDFTHFVWDVIVSAILIEPEIIIKEVTKFVDVNDQFGLSYGQSLPFPLNGPEGAQSVRIILEIDSHRFWNMVNSKHYWESIRK